jgi:hypothetical protein
MRLHRSVRLCVQLAKGLTHANAALREQTLKAMQPLAGKLSARTLNSTLLKQLDKLQARPLSPSPCSSSCMICRDTPAAAPAAHNRLLARLCRAMLRVRHAAAHSREACMRLRVAVTQAAAECIWFASQGGRVPAGA